MYPETVAVCIVYIVYETVALNFLLHKTPLLSLCYSPDLHSILQEKFVVIK